MLSSRSKNREIILDYADGHSIITRVLRSGRLRQKRVREKDVMTETGSTLSVLKMKEEKAYKILKRTRYNFCCSKPL